MKSDFLREVRPAEEHQSVPFINLKASANKRVLSVRSVRIKLNIGTRRFA
jgi:hypothetical protein